MKFLLIALLLCVVGAKRGPGSEGDAEYRRYDYNEEGEPVGEETISEEEYYGGYDRYHTRRPRTEGVSVFSVPNCPKMNSPRLKFL